MNQKLLDEIRSVDCARAAAEIRAHIESELASSGAAGLVFGLSGGVDSAVLAYLCAGELRDRTLAITMPDGAVTPASETADALAVASGAGIRCETFGIGPAVSACAGGEGNAVALGNLRARIRAAVLYRHANSLGYLVLGSSDRSEYLLGYFTKHGDGAADLAPISKLYKLQVREVARHLGVPERVVSKKSSPHLWEGHEAEAELGATYEEVDSALYCLLDRGMGVGETAAFAGVSEEKVRRILGMHEASAHKRAAVRRPGWAP